MEMLILLALIMFAAPMVLSIIALTRMERHRRRIAALEKELSGLRDQFQRRPSEAWPAPPPAPERETAPPAPSTLSPPMPKEAARPPVPSAVRPPAAIPAPRQAPPIPAPLPVPKPQPSSADAPVASSGPRPPGRPAAPPPPRPPVFRMPSFDWEGLVGVKLFSWVAGVALLLAAVFFLRYSIDRGWLMPPVRMAIGLLVGIGLLVLCEMKAARKYPVTANAMDASAIAILFSTFFAAHALWHIIGSAADFLLLVLVTIVAVLLSIRRDSMFIALLGLVGGFSTPALLSTGENRPIPLFGYLLLLNVGLAWVASRKKWPLLTALSLAFTTIYQWAWVAKFLTAAQLPLAAGIFLIFPLSLFAALTIGRKQDRGKSLSPLHDQATSLSASLPLLFAVYIAAVPGFGAHYAILFGFLFLVVAGLFAVALVRGFEILHACGGLSAILVFAVWLGISYHRGAWPSVLAFVALFVLFYLAAPFIAHRFGREFSGPGRHAVFAGAFLLFPIPALIVAEPACAAPGLPFLVLFVLIFAAAAVAIASGRSAVYYLAAFFALAAEAGWSSKYLTPERLYAAMALYLVFGLFYIGVPMAARRWKRPLRPEGGSALLVLSSLALLVFLAAGPTAQVAVWAIALLLLVLNAGLFFESSAGRVPIAALAGTVLSWTVLAALWASASLNLILLPALAVVCGFALLVLAGNIWMQGRASGMDAHLLRNGIFLGLAGHLFLFAVAAQQSLAVPPWPLLGVLLVLDLAVGAAALYARRCEPHLSALVASAFILMVWVATARVAPWPTAGILSAGGLALIGFVWIRLAGRIGLQTAPFAWSAVVAVVLAQFVCIVAAWQPGAPGLGLLLPTHLIFIAALLALAWFRGTQALAIVAVVPAAIAVSLWQAAHAGPEFWSRQLLFALPVYLVFVGYPLVLGRRAGASAGPYLAAIMASVPFFFQARHSIIQAGAESIIGILPVAQATLMAVLLKRLLDIEPRGSRHLGRLALVAGAALAFVTVAIPLQLEKEWITIGWALEGAALAWLYGKIPRRGLLYAATGLLVTVFVRLALNPSVLSYAPRGSLRILNWYLYAYLVPAAAMIFAGRLLAKTKDAIAQTRLRVSALCSAGGAILLFLLLNIEIADYYSAGPAITFNFSAALAQDLTYTLGWALFAVALLATGIAARSKPARVSAIILLVVTILKCFVHDLARLGGLYRVISFVGLALCLALVALALQKFVLSLRKEPE